MIYYRIALQLEQPSSWEWKSCTLTSLSSVVDALRVYNHLPSSSIRVFFSATPSTMDGMLARANLGLISQSLPVDHFPQAHTPSLSELMRLEVELGCPGDHDVPYNFSLPVFLPTIIAWTRLLSRVRQRELVP